MFWCCLALLLQPPATGEIQLDVTEQTVTVTGLSDADLALLRAPAPGHEAVRVYFDRASLAERGDQPTMMGRWRVVEQRLVFQGRFPFSRGYDHLLVVQPRADQAPSTWVFSLPDLPKPPAAKFVGLFPDSDQVPENLLRWYLFFDQPMAHGYAYQNIRLEDEQGRLMGSPFVVVPEELWDPARRRLTLFLDPGRIKRGVGPHLEHGSPLQAGRAYVLVIDGTWPDRHGSPLGADVRHRFRVTEADRRSPQRADWVLNPPPAGGQTPLRVVFDEPLDREQVPRFLDVADASGTFLPGDWWVQPDGRAATFVPHRLWRTGTYALHISSRLEDWAGNHLIALFDHALEENNVGVAPHQTFTRVFRVD
ncbi:Ig-like domain-containing protein [Acanthopleuribacter pedis]|uniref:SbsA Ig-like domain-containing protein n=1 Tax=Acanthopleuribacter pedis TaxID=442870 RepID=A0A8J7QM97_9BACT|nr:Ig-like domain-containing protein [Acanthopleuribacter pedis]MBO1320963.1 hypothetical protein [Acanthopleuribacter pedis]